MTVVRERFPDPPAYNEMRGLGLKRMGKNLRGRCPVHQGDGDAFAMHAESGAFYCHSCGAKGGDVLDLERFLAGGVDFRTACTNLGAWQDDPKDTSQPRRRPLPVPARDALEIAGEDMMHVAVAMGNWRGGVELTDDDIDAVIEAAGRVHVLAKAVLA